MNPVGVSRKDLVPVSQRAFYGAVGHLNVQMRIVNPYSYDPVYGYAEEWYTGYPERVIGYTGGGTANEKRYWLTNEFYATHAEGIHRAHTREGWKGQP